MSNPCKSNFLDNYHSTETALIPNHKCILPIRKDTIDSCAAEGAMKTFKRKLFIWTTISPKHPCSSAIFKSTTAILNEQKRHSTNNKSVIHPFSMIRLQWETAMIFVYLLRFTAMIFKADATILDYTNKWSSVLNALRILDAIFYFVTGYFDEKKREVVLVRRKIVASYVKGFCIFDIVAVTPLEFSLLKEILPKIYLLQLIEIVRLPTIIKYIQNFCKRLNISCMATKVIIFNTWFYLIILWSAAVYHEVRTIKSIGTQESIIESIFGILRCLMLIRIMKDSNNSIFMMLQILYVILGSILNAVILYKIIFLYKKYVTSKSRYKYLIGQLKQYINYKDLPQYLRNKIFHFIEFKYRKRIVVDKYIKKYISSILHDELMMENCKEMLEKVAIFKDVPQPILMKLVSKLKSDIYLTNDIIVSAGDTGSSMYFIYIGSVAVYTENGKEICHLNSGSYFGEIALLFNRPRVATVVAITECELYRLNRKDYQDAFKLFPVLQEKIKNEALRRLKNTIKFLES